MTTKLRTNCPACDQRLRIDEAKRGKSVRCPACRESFVVTDPVEASLHSIDSTPAAMSMDTGNLLKSETLNELVGPSRQSTEEPTLRKLGRFELKSVLGAGGFGKVYRAYDPHLERFVALKVPTFGPNQKNRIARFLAEAKAAARLKHANIVTTFESGKADKHYYIASEFIEGDLLSSRIKSNRPDTQSAVQIVRKLADALAYAHQQGIVHRDIKPHNVLIDSDGEPQLMDFGLAKRSDDQSNLTTDGALLGTPAYMSPEQARGELYLVDAQSDQYSLGVVLYHLLTGATPVEGSPHMVIATVAKGEIHSIREQNPEANRDLDAICQKAMHPDKHQRYPDCRRFAEDLNAWHQGKPILARPMTSLQLITRRIAENGLIVVLFSIMISMTVLAAIFAHKLSLQSTDSLILSAGMLEDKLPDEMPEKLSDQVTVQPADEVMDQTVVSIKTTIDGDFVPVELLFNGSCEEPVPADGSLPGWRIQSGAWGPRRSNPDAADGHAYFFAGRSNHAELTQDISLAEFSVLVDQQKLTFMLDGLVRSFKMEPPDTAEVAVAFFGADETQSLTRYTSGQVANVDNWEKVLLSGVVPQGTRYARVYLISRRRGGGYNNDGYFDNLKFHVGAVKDGPTEMSSSEYENVVAVPKVAANQKPEDPSQKETVSEQKTTKANKHQLRGEREREHLGVAVEREIELPGGEKLMMVLIPPGEFMMGSPADEADRHDNEGPQHKVHITKPFYMGVTEVTQGQWFAVMKTMPWAGQRDVKEGNAYPATYVSWDDAVAFCEKLSALEGKEYRLPTEAEWEYACRGGTSTSYSFGVNSAQLSRHGWFRDNAWKIGEKYAHEVGGKQSNPFGLCDMHGNVCEWCSDWAEPYRANATVDPQGPSTGSYRVSRGGSWYGNPASCRAANRGTPDLSYRSGTFGFRLALSSSGQ